MARLKSAWDKLSMNERALFIKLSLLHGLSNLKDIRDTYNMYIDKLQNSAENYYNGVVYSIMSLRPGTDRSFTDIGEALLHPNKKGMYSGNIGEGGWPNWDRDLLKLYLNKDTTGFTEIDPHDSEYKGSYNYNTNDSSIKSYKGDLIIGHEPNVSPAIYQLAKDMAKDNIKILRNMDKDIIFNYNDYKLNRDRGVREEDWDYHMQPGEFVDDVRRYKRNYTLSNDEPVIQASKMWDFTPHKNMDLMEKIKSNMLSSAGSPFILRDAQKLLLSNSDDLYTRVLNTSILEDALDNNVMIKNKDNTLSPLTIFPEIFVHPQSQDWDYYLPSNNIPKDELPTLTDDAVISIDPTYKTVVNEIFKDTPLVGHYITINNMDTYPYTGYKTLHDEATRTSYNDGGPLAHKFDGELVELSLNILLKDNTITNYHINTKEPISIKNADNYSDALGWIADWLSKRTNQLSNNERRYSRNDFLFNHDFGLLDVGQLVYDKEVKRMLSTPIIIDERKKNKYNIGHVNNTYTYDDFPDIKHVLENQYSYGDKKYNIEDIKDYFNWTELGHYKPYGKHIYISPYGDESTLLHELNHSRESYPQEKVIYKNRKLQEGVELDDYLDKPTEIYSRLMQFRKHNNINPEHKYTEKDLQELKTKAKDFNILNRYDDTTILYLLNDIAKNNVTPHNSNPFEVSNNTYLAALGGPLAHKKSGEELGESLELNYPNLLPEVEVYPNMLPEVEVYPKWYDLEWAKRSAAGLSALGTIATYIPHPYAKAAGLIAQVPDIYYDTRSLVSDVKNTDNWIDEGLNTLILDPFFRKKRPLIERLGKGVDYLGPFKKINIPLSALDAINDGYYAITGNKLSKDVQSLVDNKKSTGGPLYPFSFEKNPFLKTPVVRYDEGGHLFGFGDWLTNLFNSTGTTTTVNTEPAPLDLGELATRQAYAESQFDSNAVSPANAVGLFLVTPNTLAYYNSKTGNTFTAQDLYDDTINKQVRDWYMDDLMNRPWNTKNNPSDSVQYAKSLGAYNWGPTNLVDTLNKAKADGVDIYNSWDWLTYLPTETRDYINFVLRNLNNSVHRNNMMYNRATDKYLSKVSAIKSSK